MTQPVREVMVGPRKMLFPSDELQPLIDNTHLLNDPEQLRSTLEEQGYLFLRGLHDRSEVLAARLAVLGYVRAAGEGKLRPDTPWQQGLLEKRCGIGCIPKLEGVPDITHCPEVLAVLEGHRPKAFFRSLLGEDAITFDYKWLRGVGESGFTGAHVDRVYMNWGTQRLFTMWTPLDDVTVDMGTLVICEGSHRLPSFQKLQDTYGNLDVEKDNLNGTGWFTTDPKEITEKFGGQWKTSDFSAGDVLVFSMRTVHMSTVNTTEKLRISCDTRWQRASDPADSRYMGDGTYTSKKAYGDSSKDDTVASSPDEVTIGQLKEKWGLQ